MSTTTQYPYQYQYQYQYPPYQQGDYPYSQQSQGGYPYSQQSQGGYPYPQQSQGGYYYPQQPQGSYPYYQQSQGGYPYSQQPQGGYPYPQQSQGIYPPPQENDQAPPPSYTPFPETTTVEQDNKPVIKKDQETEIKEALEVANKALGHLYKGKKYLSKASKWGMVDIAGGGFISTMVKQGNMTEARNELNRAKDELAKLKNELEDIEEMNTLQVSSMLEFSDFVFDSLFFDVLVQSKINEAKGNCKKTITKVENIKKELEAKLNKITSNKI
ncbi:hypothetical protein BCR32DRAFT_276468 [Anaeromyces robustus]|jgi:hypothetical protein|uniref:Uncharacterized protein n=1 Tax=Anaeromyces robustus TaxID=1754192 RepID=A0A1Y1XHE7_9FUNG|nr:hypothetical protein BCR32DRAFT_276468 [Anaeromyces robustus]|eukprot:ORX85173.1 hypothetical protein BCR32DRAFT_276468 [Anaeromyces robustus]